METFKLIKTETNVKAAKYLYQVIDENGNVLMTRKSNREYIAATIDGLYFFGRLDLIGKGMHGSDLKSLTNEIKNGYWKSPNTGKIYPRTCEEIEGAKKRLNELNQIAYL
jgi:hypothetical protein